MTYWMKIAVSLCVGAAFGLIWFLVLVLLHAYVGPHGTMEEYWLNIAVITSLMLTGFVARDFHKILERGSRYDS